MPRPANDDPAIRELRRGLLLFLAVYSVGLAFLLPKLSLWIDEILTLIGALKPDLPSLFAYLRTTPGATPLAFLVPGWTIQLLGYSTFTARLSSAIFSVAACPAIFLLARRLGLRAPLLAVVVFALCPLQFRYAMEARPYSMALCLSAWSTVVFLSLRDNPRSLPRAMLYGLLTLTGTSTVAFTLFVPAAHLVWAGFRFRENRRLFVICATSIAISGVALVPWYLYAREGWADMVAVQRLGSFVNWRSATLILHELTGAGYGGTILMLAVACWGASRLTAQKSFWIGYSLLPVLLVLLADLIFHYFLAVRQMIFVLAPLSLLFVAGIEAMGRFGKLLAGVFLAIALYADQSWISRPREDWQAAASLAGNQVREGACVVFIPADAELMYGFFRPDLHQHQCTAREFAEADSIALAASPFDPDHMREMIQTQLMARGLTMRSEQTFHGPAVDFYRRPLP